ncbi:MAG: glycosyltransferase family 4 protein [Alloprevotella sp.]
MQHVVCFHLYNDFSGSPRVLRTVLKGLLAHGFRVDLVTSEGGVLDGLEGQGQLVRHSCPYRFSPRPLVTILRYLAAQVYTFCLSFRWLFDGDAVFYINTLLPAGPALAGRIMGKRVVYHYHENAFAKGFFYRTLAWLMKCLAHRIICVSAYQASFLSSRKTVVVPNAPDAGFMHSVRPDPRAAFARQTVLMLASLKSYKGLDEFASLSLRLPQYKFVLVLGDTPENVEAYFSRPQRAPRGANLTIYARQADVAPFYNRASLVLNLTDRAKAVETFGLTAAEAMCAGLPVIVPTVGGIAELVNDGENGYKIDVAQLDEIERRIRELLSDEIVYTQLANGALRRARQAFAHTPQFDKFFY